MKKTTTIVLALVLALSMFASFAFVVNPGTGGALKPEKSPLAITGFFATSNDAILGGARVYAPLANNTDAAYAKNEVIRFAVTMDVMNHLVPSNGVDADQLLPAANPATLTVTSSTVDFAVSNMPGQQALHVPLSQLVNAIQSKVANAGIFTAPATAAHGAAVDTAKNIMTIKVKPLASTAVLAPNDSTFAAIAGDPIVLYTPSTVSEAKASYAFIFTGITKGEITEKGLAKLVTAKSSGSAFIKHNPAGTPPTTPVGTLVSVVKNGRTYYVEKVVEAANASALVKHPVVTTGLSSTYYNMLKVGYRVYLLDKKVVGTTDDTYTLSPVAQLDSESITWLLGGSDLVGTEVEGLGYSLGLEKITLATADQTVPTGDPLTAAPAPTAARVFRTVLSDGTVRYILGDPIGTKGVGDTAFDATEMARLNTMLADFGFSTADSYTYKLEDKYFTTAATDDNVLNATYNNGTVTPVEPEEEGDVDEGTGEEELPEEGDIDEDLDEDGDITDEEEEVPAETGDFSASIAIALAAAAIVAAAALTVVMKKARD